MSRSRKKIGIIKDKGLPRSFYNRKFRRVNKYRIKLGKEPKHLAEVVNGYCICDYKFIWQEHQIYWFPITEHETRMEFLKRKRTYFGK